MLTLNQPKQYEIFVYVYSWDCLLAHNPFCDMCVVVFQSRVTLSSGRIFRLEPET